MIQSKLNFAVPFVTFHPGLLQLHRRSIICEIYGFASANCNGTLRAVLYGNQVSKVTKGVLTLFFLTLVRKYLLSRTSAKKNKKTVENWVRGMDGGSHSSRNTDFSRPPGENNY